MSDVDRGILSSFDRKKSSVRASMTGVHLLLILGLVVGGLGPILWLAKSALTSTNTLIIAAGSWLFSLFLATTAGYGLSILRPRYANILNGAVLATLFVPSVVLLVPLYLTIVHPPIGGSLLNNYLAVWLPAAANALNILLVKRFFDSLPHEVFEAARTDGAGAFRVFWSIVLPMSRPILGVVSVFAIIASLKDYLWPSLVLPTQRCSRSACVCRRFSRRSNLMSFSRRSPSRR